MSRSLTLPVPSSRQLGLAVAIVIGAIVVVLAGIKIGAVLTSPSEVMGLVAGGELHEVQVLGGAVYLGRIVDEDGTTLRLSRPAVVRQQQAPAASPGSQGPLVIVQSLVTDPYDVGSDIVIPLENVTLIGVVEPSSALARAYGEAMGLIPAPSPSP